MHFFEQKIFLSRFMFGVSIVFKHAGIKMKYDFDYLKDLYKKDPEKFNEVTKEMINDFIESLPEEKQDVYRARQWRLEQELNKIKDPIERMNKMVQIFWVGVNKFIEATRLTETANVVYNDTDESKVLKFKKKTENLENS